MIYLCFPIKITREYELVKNKKAKITIEILE